MPRNIEIKAQITRIEALLPKIRAIGARGPVDIVQDDTFFVCGAGRLKLRTFSEHEGELIYYRRSDQRGPKESRYVRAATSAPEMLREALTLAYGQCGRVQKHRTLFVSGRTRIHLDDVVGLGHFIELEVVLEEDESAEAGVHEANELLQRLGISHAQLIEGAYVDLLQAAEAR
jgi:predicted adenylyl cyclase CyaB